MPIKQIWNDKIAAKFAEMTFDEQAELYRKFKKGF